MDCQYCGKPLVLIEGYDNPDICAAGSRVYHCPDHPLVVERSEWYCPYIPLIKRDETPSPSFLTSMRLHENK